MINKYQYDVCSGTYRIKDVGLFFNEKDAQEYIAFKNQPRMSKLHKEIALQCLNAIRRNGIRPTDYNIKYLDEAIEIISNLPTGD